MDLPVAERRMAGIDTFFSCTLSWVIGVRSPAGGAMGR